MGGGKGSAPPAPNYQPIATSDLQAAQLAAQTSSAQLDFARQQYADQAPYTQAYMKSMAGVMQSDIDSQKAAQAQAGQAQDYYKQTYQPIETQFAQEAQAYNTPAQAAQASAAAQGDVATAFGGQRQAALQSLESYGIDPSQTRYGALDLGTRISQAAAQSAAGTQSALNSKATGLALQGEAINIGRGYPGQIAQSYSTATGAGQGAVGAGGAGVNAGIGTSTAYGNMMGSPAQWAGLQQSGLGGAANALNMGYQNQMSAFNANTAIAQNQASGIGSLVGAGLALGLHA
jgi:hypothetical protein